MWLMPLNIDPYYVTNTSKKFIRNAVKAGKPFFMVYFSSNSHFPYGSQYPYYQLYADRTYRGPHKYRKVDMMKTYSGYDLSAADKEQIVALYDGSVRMFDDQVGEMLAIPEEERPGQRTRSSSFFPTMAKACMKMATAPATATTCAAPIPTT